MSKFCFRKKSTIRLQGRNLLQELSIIQNINNQKFNFCIQNGRFKPQYCLILIIFTLKQHTHACAHTHSSFGERLPISGKISLNILLKCSLLSCSCQSPVACVYPTVARVCPWSMIVHVSFPGHTHFFDKHI